MRVLVSGFGPFLEEKVNPSESIVSFVNSAGLNRPKNWGALEVRGVILPVDFDEAFPQLEKIRAEFQPDVVLSFGLASGRSAIEIEQLAINFRGAIDSEAPISLPTTLPSETLINDLLARGIAARASMSAGTYVCNHLFFKLQDRLRFTRVRSGFIHVPSFEHLPWPQLEAAIDSIFTTFAAENTFRSALLKR